jgi:hypothetical protein
MSATASGGTPLTVRQWITRHIDHLTGVEQATKRRYRAYLVNDIDPAFGSLPLVALSREDVTRWVNAMFDHREPVPPGATARWDRREMVFVTESEFAKLPTKAITVAHQLHLARFTSESSQHGGCGFSSLMSNSQVKCPHDVQLDI